jgi:hypothetical protein
VKLIPGRLFRPQIFTVFSSDRRKLFINIFFQKYLETLHKFAGHIKEILQNAFNAQVRREPTIFGSGQEANAIPQHHKRYINL